MSFDVVNLYTNVPIDYTLNYVNEILLENNELSEDVRTEFFNTLKFCLSFNYCQVNNVCYKFNNGLPMGCPLAPLISEISTHKLETLIFNSNNLFVGKIIYWFRYVDDVICAFDAPDCDI